MDTLSKLYTNLVAIFSQPAPESPRLSPARKSPHRAKISTKQLTIEPEPVAEPKQKDTSEDAEQR